MDKLSKLEEIIKVLDKDVPTNKDVAEVIEAVLKVIREVKEKLEIQITGGDQTLLNQTERLSVFLDEAKSDLEKKINKLSQDTLADKVFLTKNLEAKLEEVKDLIPSISYTEIYGKIKEVEDKIVPSEEIKTEELRDKLEILEGDERLAIDAIRGLKEELERIAGTARTRGVFSSIRRVYQPYVDDFSAQTDGSTKIFYLSRAPLKSDTVLVWGSDFPIILRPTTDFTIAGKTLTLTTAVPAPSSGATLLVRYDA